MSEVTLILTMLSGERANVAPGWTHGVQWGACWAMRTAQVPLDTETLLHDTRKSRYSLQYAAVISEAIVA